MNDLSLFSILGIETKEVMHSKMLAFFLAANGKFKSGNSEVEYFNCGHNNGSDFLKLFLEEVGLKSLRNVKDNYEVIIEADAGDYGRIDILIKFNDYWLAIENKIYAGDQKNQLQRYKKYLKNSVDKYDLIYLTLDGRNPSDLSRGNLIEGKDFCCVSYKKDISNWLDKCITVKHEGDQLKSMIQSYKTVIAGLVREYVQADKIIENKEFDVTEGKNSDIYKNLVYPYVITNIIGDAKVFNSNEEFYPEGNSFYIWVDWGKTKKIEYDLYFTLSDGVVTGCVIKIDRTDSEQAKWTRIDDNNKWLSWGSENYYKYGPESVSSFIDKVKRGDKKLKEQICEMKQRIINNK